MAPFAVDRKRHGKLIEARRLVIMELKRAAAAPRLSMIPMTPEF